MLTLALTLTPLTRAARRWPRTADAGVSHDPETLSSAQPAAEFLQLGPAIIERHNPPMRTLALTAVIAWLTGSLLNPDLSPWIGARKMQPLHTPAHAARRASRTLTVHHPFLAVDGQWMHTMRTEEVLANGHLKPPTDYMQTEVYSMVGCPCVRTHPMS
jgi:hypothetical protein